MSERYSSSSEQQPTFADVYAKILQTAIRLSSQAVTKRARSFVVLDHSHPTYPASVAEANPGKYLPVAHEFEMEDGTQIVLNGENPIYSYYAHIRLSTATQQGYETTGQYALFIDGTIRETLIEEDGRLGAGPDSICLDEAIKLLDGLASSLQF